MKSMLVRYLRTEVVFKYLPNRYVVMHDKLRLVMDTAQGDITDITCIEAKQTQFGCTAKLEG